jgi:hypothetical protein
MAFGEDVALDLVPPAAVRPVVVRPALLVLDDVALVVQVLLRQRVEEGPHPVRLEPEGQLDLVGRDGLVVVRPVQPCRPVAGPADRLEEREVLGLADVRAALEHDVLEQVGEARLAGLLVLRADGVPDVDGRDRREVVLGDDQAKAVVEALLGERDGRLGHGRLRG